MSEIIIDNLIKNSNFKDKDFLLKLFIMNLVKDYRYNDDKVNRVLELMLDNSKFVKAEHIDMVYITKNIDKFAYYADKYYIKDVTLGSIDNINSIIQINYKYLEKINENRADVDYNDNCVNISFIDYPEVLKKS